MDEYLSCKEYEGHARSADNSRFSTFTKDGEFYFAMLNDDGTVALKSQGYKSEAARDNGIASVETNRLIEARFSIVEAGGKHYVALKAANHQEIARSCPYDSHAAADAYLNPPAVVATPAAPRDEYLKCSEYEGHGKSSVNSRFSTFSKDGEFYFAMLDKNGNVVLKSQGYKSEAARDNGIASVETNRVIKERFSIIAEGGKHYVSLKAGNHQEIARSCPYDSHAAADAFINPPVVAAAAAASSSDARLDDYLACKDYKGHTRLKENNNFSTFSHDGEHYFALLDKDGNVVLRSEGYKTEKSRDNGIASVTKNREIKERFSIEQIRSHYFVVLKAGNNQEIGRSCPYDSHAAADAFINPPVVAAAAAASSGDARLDDYLACKKYKGHPRSKQNKDFSTFSHDGEHYFALLDSDGDVLLRSEGYKTEKSRDNGIASVTKNREIKERFSVEQIRNYHFVVLKAGNNQEIGRSCPYTDKAKAVFPMGSLAAPAVAAVAAVTPKPTPKPAPKPAPVKKVVETTAKTAPIAAATTSNDEGGGLGWLWWLLPLLALALCLWCCRGCFGCGADKVVPPVTTELPVINEPAPVAVDSMKIKQDEAKRLEAEAAAAKAAAAERESERQAEIARKKAEAEAYRGPKSSGY